MQETMQETMRLRDYQASAVTAVEASWDAGRARPMVVAATGAGKTCVMAALADRAKTAGRGRTLIVVPRLALLDQTIATVHRWAPSLSVGIVQGARDETDADVVVGMVQTLIRDGRLDRLLDIGVVMIDEAHHAVAAGYVQLLAALRVGEPDGPVAVGVTATPGGRHDHKRVLGPATFDHIAHRTDLGDLIAAGHLRDVSCTHLRSKLDYGQLRQSGGDYTDASLEAALVAGDVLATAAAGYRAHAGARRGIAFAPTVAAAQQLAAALTGEGIPAGWVSAATKPADRQELYAQLRTGRLQVLCSVGVLTEGFDDPTVSCALIVRPTRARGLFVQMAGRALRQCPTAPGVGDPETALVLDVYSPPRLGLVGIRALTAVGDDAGVHVREGETVQAAIARAAAFQARHLAERTARDRQVALLAAESAGPSAWVQVHGVFHMGRRARASAARSNRGTLIAVETGPASWDLILTAPRQAPAVLATGLSQDEAWRRAEKVAAESPALGGADAAWRARPASAKQLDLLDRLRLQPPTDGTAGAAADDATAFFAAKDTNIYLRGLRR